MSFFASIVSGVTSFLSVDSDCALPSVAASAEIDRLREELTTPFTLELHGHLLKELSDVIYQKSNGEFMTPSFEPIGMHWKTIGFQHEDPLKDIRGGGVLCIKNLIYFVKNSEEAIPMIRVRSNRDDGANYPWAAAAINVTRMVAKLFEVVAQNGFSKVDVHGSKRYWDKIEGEDGFNNVFVASFLQLDRSFEAIQGTYLDFPKALQVCGYLLSVQLA
jgi:hypothetical protein